MIVITTEERDGPPWSASTDLARTKRRAAAADRQLVPCWTSPRHPGAGWRRWKPSPGSRPAPSLGHRAGARDLGAHAPARPASPWSPIQAVGGHFPAALASTVAGRVRAERPSAASPSSSASPSAACSWPSGCSPWGCDGMFAPGHGVAVVATPPPIHRGTSPGVPMRGPQHLPGELVGRRRLHPSAHRHPPPGVALARADRPRPRRLSYGGSKRTASATSSDQLQDLAVGDRIPLTELGFGVVASIPAASSRTRRRFHLVVPPRGPGDAGGTGSSAAAVTVGGRRALGMVTDRRVRDGAPDAQRHQGRAEARPPAHEPGRSCCS